MRLQGCNYVFWGSEGRSFHKNGVRELNRIEIFMICEGFFLFLFIFYLLFGLVNRAKVVTPSQPTLVRLLASLGTLSQRVPYSSTTDQPQSLLQPQRLKLQLHVSCHILLLGESGSLSPISRWPQVKTSGFRTMKIFF